MGVTLVDRQQAAIEKRRRDERLGKIPPARLPTADILSFPVAPSPQIVRAPAPVVRVAPQTTPTLALVLSTVSAFYDIPVAALTNSSMKIAKLAIPRQVAMYLGYELALMSFPMMARKFNRHQTTCHHGHKRIQTRRKSDDELDRALLTLTAKLQGRLP